MKAAEVVLRTLEGALLVVFGGMLLMLVDTGTLWYFINPKYSWLIASGGAGLFVLGVFVPFAAGHRPKLGRMAVLICFLLASGVAQEAMRQAYAPPEPDASAPGTSIFDPGMPEMRPAETHLNIGGREYLKVNEAELFTLADKGEVPERVVFQGMVRHNPDLGNNGRAAVIRVVVVCCLADAVAVGFRVEDGALADLPDGAWVRVAGRLKADKADSDLIDGVSIPGVVMTVVNDAWVVEAESVEPVDQPGMPFIFEVRGRPPYAY